MDAGHKGHYSFMNVTKQIYKTEGLPGFMRGLMPSMVKSTLTAGSYFSMLYYFEETLKRLQIFQNQACIFIPLFFNIFWLQTQNTVVNAKYVKRAQFEAHIQNEKEK